MRVGFGLDGTYFGAIPGELFVGDSVVLVCAVLGSLAAGVLAAWGVCQAVFGLFRMWAAAEPAPTPAPEVAVPAAPILEG